MKRALIASIASLVFAGMTFAEPAGASVTTLPECNESSLWTVEFLLIADWPDFSEEVYLCMPDGWLLIGRTYCSGGNCSSD